jgi:hypothetical protein
LIVGGDGSGKKYTARLLAAVLLGIATEKIDNHPYFSVISKDESKSEISIDAARSLTRQLSLKAVSEHSGPIKRVAIIEDADYMSTEAQNAILKLLEEPPAGSLIILTADSESALLPTVVSRAQKINIMPVSLEDSKTFFNNHPTKEIESAWRLSGGSAGLMRALLEQSGSHSLKVAVEQAKDVLKMNTYERAVYLQNLSKDKQQFAGFLYGLSKVLSALHESTIRAGNLKGSEKILEARKVVGSLQDSAQANTNTRLLALSLAINTPI